MKKVLLSGLILATVTFASTAQTKKEKEVAMAVEKMRRAMIDPDKTVLENLVADDLSYGHSGGHVDDKKEFVEKLVSGKSDFVTIELTEQTIHIHGKLAIVRHKLTAATNDGGKPAEVHLLVLLVWEKKGSRWKLLARQAVKAA